MGLFAFRRLRELEALAEAGASFTIAEPAPILEEIPEPPAPKRRRVAKSKPEPLNGDRH